MDRNELILHIIKHRAWKNGRLKELAAMLPGEDLRPLVDPKFIKDNPQLFGVTI